MVWSHTGQDTVVATWLFQDANFQTVGGAICNVPPGGFSINPADAPANTKFIALSLERIRKFSASVPGSAGVASQVAGTIEKRGDIAREAAAQ